MLLTTAQASLAAGDFFMMYQVVEGPLLRELMGDVTSISMLVRSSVANLKFGFSITDSGINYTLTKLCTLGRQIPGRWSKCLIFLFGHPVALIL